MSKHEYITEAGNIDTCSLSVGDRVHVTVEGKDATVIELCMIGDIGLDSVKVRFDKPFRVTGEFEGWYGPEFVTNL